jgi:hypothetical protein
VNDEDASRKRGEEEVQEDLELHDEDASQAVGGATADASLDVGVHFKYDIKGQKEG